MAWCTPWVGVHLAGFICRRLLDGDFAEAADGGDPVRRDDDAIVLLPVAEAGDARDEVVLRAAFVTVGMLVDVEKEVSRLQGQVQKLEKEIGGLDKRLSNPGFTEKAKPEVVAEARGKHAELQERRERLERTLAALGAA